MQKVLKAYRYRRLVKHVGEHPMPELGKWAVDSMKLIKQLAGRGAAIHFAALLASSDLPQEGMDRALAYMRHLEDEFGGGEK